MPATSRRTTAADWLRANREVLKAEEQLLRISRRCLRGSATTDELTAAKRMTENARARAQATLAQVMGW